MSGSSNCKTTVLIVDDDRVLRNLAAYSLREMTGDGLAFETCKTGAEAVQRMLRGAGIDLILMDVRMPQMNGIEAITQIRQISRVPIIVLSAYGDSATRDAAAAAGANLFLTKPHSYLKLAAQIQRLVREYHCHDSQPEQLRQLHHNLSYLEQQAAGYGPLAVPLELHNQIDANRRQIEAIENGDTPQ